MDTEDFPTQVVTLKVCYTHETDAQPCMTKIDNFHAPVCRMNGHEYGSVDLLTCIDAVCQASPEVVSNESSTDYAVYSLDVVEQDSPYVGHGKLSHILHDSDPSSSRLVGFVSTTRQPFRSAIRCLTINIKLVGLPGTMGAPYFEYPHANLASSYPVLGRKRSRVCDFEQDLEEQDLEEQQESTTSRVIEPFIQPAKPKRLRTVQHLASSPMETVSTDDDTLHGKFTPNSEPDLDVFAPTQVKEPAVASDPPIRKSTPKLSKRSATMKTKTISSKAKGKKAIKAKPSASTPATMVKPGKINDKELSSVKRCDNCAARYPQTWRRINVEQKKGKETVNVKRIVCSPCGDYYEKYNKIRPPQLWQGYRRKEAATSPMAPTPTDHEEIGTVSSPGMGLKSNMLFSDAPSSPPAADYSEEPTPVNTSSDTYHTASSPQLYSAARDEEDPSTPPTSEPATVAHGKNPFYTGSAVRGVNTNKAEAEHVKEDKENVPPPVEERVEARFSAETDLFALFTSPQKSNGGHQQQQQRTPVKQLTSNELNFSPSSINSVSRVINSMLEHSGGDFYDAANFDMYED